jgi:hypothetical protein
MVVEKARGRIHKSARIGRRVIAGGMGLGFGATFGWVNGRIRHVQPPPQATNSAFVWARAANDCSTIVWIHNYWSDTYDIPNPTISCTLLSGPGIAVASVEVDLPKDGTIGVDVRTICRDHHIDLPFEGELLLEVTHEKIMAGRPLQVFAEYVHDSGEATGVHGQFGFTTKPFANLVASMRVEEGNGARTSFVIVNSYTGPARRAIRPVLELYSADGRTMKKRLPAIPQLASRRIYTKDVFPTADEFLGGSTGHARVLMPCPSSRMATLIEFPDGRDVVNHGTDSRLLDQGPGLPRDWSTTWPVAGGMVLLGPNRDTVISLPNNWGPYAEPYVATIDVFSPDGARLASQEVRVAKHGWSQVSVGELLASHGVSQSQWPVAHAEVSLGASDSHPFYRPATFDIMVAILDHGRLAGEVGVGGELFNCDIPPGLRMFPGRRTRTFGRVQIGPDVDTHIVLVHPTSDASHTVVAEPVLTLIGGDGRQRSSLEDVTIPVHGCVQLSVHDDFPDAVAVLGESGAGAVRVRNLNARLYGYYYTERRGAVTFPICHLIGG